MFHPIASYSRDEYAAALPYQFHDSKSFGTGFAETSPKGVARRLAFHPDQQKCARCLNEGRQRARGKLVEALNDRTIDGEVAARERGSGRSRKQAILNESQNLELFTQLAPISLVDCILRPLEQLSIPDWTVIQGIGRYSANDIVRPKTVRQVG